MRRRFKLLTAAFTATMAVGTVMASAGAAVHPASVHHAKSRAKLVTVNLSYVPYSNDSSLFLGMKEGFFRKHGLKVNLTTAVAPTFVVAALESGQQQFGFVTTVVLANLAAHGTMLKCVSSVDGNQTTNVNQDGTLLVANKNSGIKSVKDLVGKTVATVQLASLNTLDVQEMAKEAGINYQSIHFVPMGFSLMPQAVVQGTVQAAIITTPFSQTAIDNGAVLIAHPNLAIIPGESSTCFAATDTYLAHHVRIAKAFQAAMTESILYTPGHMKKAAQTLVDNGLATSLHAALTTKLGTDFNPVIKASSIAKMERLLKRFGYITTMPDPASLIFPGA